MSQIKKRNGEIVAFDLERIQRAITKAYQATMTDTGDVAIMVDDIHKEILEKQATLQEGEYIDVEQIQDLVEKILMKHWQNIILLMIWILIGIQRKKCR